MFTVADQFVQVHAAAGMRRVYGIVGDSLNGLTDALRRHGGIERSTSNGLIHTTWA